MEIFTKQEFDAVPDDHRGIWTTERYDQPHWEEERHLYMGKRTIMRGCAGVASLLVEGLHFLIVPTRREKAIALWEQLAEIPMHEDTLQAKFLHFDVGTSRYEVWLWFEEEFRVTVGEDLLLS